MKPLRLMRCTAGGSAVEFGLIAPVYFAALIGAIELGLMLWTQVGLQHATEMAARCASVNSATCSSTSAIQTYATHQAFGLSVPASTFTVASLACGNQVSASYDFLYISAYMGAPKLTLNARSCFPK